MKFKDDLFNFCPLTISLLNVVVTYELFLFMICKKKYFLLPKTNCGWSKHLLLRLKQERKFSTALIIDRHLSRQKTDQKFSVIKTNSSDDIKKMVHFGILIHILSWKHKFVMITENFWRIFWRDNWRSIISAIENFPY